MAGSQDIVRSIVISSYLVDGLSRYRYAGMDILIYFDSGIYRDLGKLGHRDIITGSGDTGILEYCYLFEPEYQELRDNLISG